MFLAFQLETKKTKGLTIFQFILKKIVVQLQVEREIMLQGQFTAAIIPQDLTHKKNDHLAASPDRLNKEWAICTRLIAAKSLKSR